MGTFGSVCFSAPAITLLDCITAKMVIEHGISAVVAVDNSNCKQMMKSTWDVMHSFPSSSSSSSCGMKRSKPSSDSSSSSSSSNISSSSSSKKLHQEAPVTDPWGPVFKNRQHFVDMHLC